MAVSTSSQRLGLTAILLFSLALASCTGGQVAGAIGDGSSGLLETDPGTAQTVSGFQLQAGIGSNLCIALPEVGATDGALPTLASCSDTARTLWTISSAGIAQASGLCLDVTGGVTTDGAPLQLWTCHADPSATDYANQRLIVGNNAITWEGRGRCVQAVQGSAGYSLAMYACQPSQSGQTFKKSQATAVVSSSAALVTGGWVTSYDLKQGLAKATLTNSSADVASTLTLTPQTTYQSITGFGASLTDSSSYLIGAKMPTAAQKTLMKNLFDPSTGIGIGIMRQPMGASDFSAVGDFSYDDSNQADPTLQGFSIAQDLKYTVPLLKQAKALNAKLFVLATPWSAPAWMKQNSSMRGSGDANLRTSAYDAFAQYFVKTYQAYAAAGIVIDAIAPQNEPLNPQGGYPTMNMVAQDQAKFIGNNLGPAMAKAAPSVQIFGYDHNWDHIDYPATLLNDAKAAPYVKAAAFHCYAGSASAMSTFHQQFPNEDIHMTECSGGAWQGDAFSGTIDLFIDSTNNWAKSVVLWNLALDPSSGPMNGGCSNCRGVVTIDPATSKVTYNLDYYAMGHFSRFVRPGAVRIKSSLSGGNMNAVSFKNLDGSLVAVVHNRDGSARKLAVSLASKTFAVTVPAKGIATVVLAGKDASST